jgi:hypothetical protein
MLTMPAPPPPPGRQEGKKKAAFRPDGAERRRDKRVRVAREKRERALADFGRLGQLDSVTIAQSFDVKGCNRVVVPSPNSL